MGAEAAASRAAVGLGEVLVAVAVPFILPVFAALVAAFYYYRQRFITASREVKRWDATSRSPV